MAPSKIYKGAKPNFDLNLNNSRILAERNKNSISIVVYIFMR